MVRIKEVAWSPDGRQLAFAADADLPTRDIYVVNTDYVHNEGGNRAASTHTTSR